MQTFMINSTEYFLPESIEETKGLIEQAKSSGKTIVMRGAGHSFPMVPDQEKDETLMHVMLTYLNKITALDWSKGTVTVQAGCHLGLDPFDPTGVSTEDNSLLFQLDPLTPAGTRDTPPGWNIPDMGGIIHQTMGGFTATGSSGGSVKYAFDDAITAVRILFHDGNGVVDKTFQRPADTEADDPFWGIGYAHLGVMGIVVEFTLQCEPGFNIAGTETTTGTADCEIALFGDGSDGKPSLEQFFTNTDYTRFYWWPQPGADKIVLWKANRESAADWKTFVPKPYQEVPFIDGSPNISSAVSGEIFKFLNNGTNFAEKLWQRWFGRTPGQQHDIAEAFAKADDWFLKALLKVFAAPGVQTFKDISWKGIPMDNRISDKLFEVWFSELWIPLNRAQEVMISLQQFYTDPVNAGTFCIEIYSAKKSNFWLNASYGTDVIRLDIFWFAKNDANPHDFYQRFWTHFSPFEYRCHWGKYLPPADSPQGATYLQNRYPKFEQFNVLRKQMDPGNIFLNPYWKEHLGL